MSTRLRLAALPLTLALAASASAQTLSVGDKAPPIQVAEWLRGKPVAAFEKGKPYVVEFWATWCGPCLKSIPHLTELAKKHTDQGLTVIGVSIWEEDPARVAPFVVKMGDKRAYTVARDDVKADDERGRNGAMAKGWMQPSGQDGIPSAFVVDREGRVAWIGHPMEMDEPLAAVMAGTWDLEKAKAEFAAAREREKRLQEFDGRLKTALGQGDFKGAVAILDELMQLDPAYATDFALMRFDLMLRSKDLDAAYAYARGVAKDKLWERADLLNQLAWIIVDPERTDLAKRDLELALLAAQRSDELTQHADPNVLDTLARVHFAQGQIEKAVAVQEKAVAASQIPEQKKQLEETLQEYRSALEPKR